MKKLLALLLSLFLLFTFSCEDLQKIIGGEEEEEEGVAEEVIENAAGATLLAGYVSVSTFETYSKNGKTATEASMSNLIITEAQSGVTFTFNNAGLDMDQDGTSDVTLDGSFVIVGDESAATITFSDFNISGEQDGDEVDVIVNGTIVTSGSDPVVFTITFTLTGDSISDSVELESVMSMPKDGSPSFTSAEIDGEDYTDDFNAALEEMFGDDGNGDGDGDGENFAAMGTIMSGYLAVNFYDEYEKNGETAVEASVSGLAISVSGSDVTFTFTNAAMDMEDDGETDFTLDGNYVFTKGETSSTIDYNDLTVTFEEDGQEMEMIINGNIAATGEDPVIYTSTFALTGNVFSGTVDVEAVMSMPAGEGGGDPSFTSVDVDGEDQLEEFNSTLSELFSEDEES